MEWPTGRHAAVEVRTSFEGQWVGGFQVVDRVESAGGGLAYRLRRRSDGVVLPALFGSDDVRVPADQPVSLG
jgi:hypothetical protein